VWKPTGNVFKTVGHIWKPTGRTFTQVGNVCPLTRIATSTIVPPREPIPIVNSTDKPVVTLVYTKKPKAANKKVPNKMEPNNSWGSSSSNVPSSLLACRLSKSSSDLECYFETDLVSSLRTNLDGSSGTDLVSSLRTDLDGSSGTDLVSSLRTDLDGSLGTDLVSSLRIDLDGSLGTDLVCSQTTDLVWTLGNRSSLTTLQSTKSVTDLTHLTQTMATTIEQQVALDEALVPSTKRCPFFKAFLVTADVPEIYMQEFGATAYVHQYSIRFKMDSKKNIVDLETFRDMLHICPRVLGQSFDELPFVEEILDFLRFLGHSAQIKTLTDVISSLNLVGAISQKKHQLCISDLGDFVYQVEHKNQKKSNEMYYPRFTKVIIHHFMTKKPLIPRRNKVNWHYVRDDILFLTIKVVSRHQNTQQYGVMLPIELTNDEIRNTKAYKEYYACATGEAAPKPKASARRKRSGSDTSITPPTAITTPTTTIAATPRLTTATKGKQPAKAKSPTDPLEVARTEAEQLKIVLRRSRQESHISQLGGSSTDEGIETKSDGESEEEETREEEEESFDPIPRTPKDSEDDGNSGEDQGLRVSEEQRLIEKEEADELYRDVDINQGRGLTLSADIEDSHVTLTLVNPDVVADLSEIELKNILIEKMEGNKSIQRSDKQRNLYKALVDAYEADKTILNSYGETAILKRRREGDDDQEGPSARSDWRSTTGFKSRQPSASESAFTEEPVQTTSQIEESSRPVFKTAAQGSTQLWISDLAKQAGSRSSFNELLDTPLDFSNFIMNRLGVDTLTPELLAGPTYELMRGSCNSLTELEYHLEEVYKATTNQLDWVNPEGQQCPHNLLQPLPLIPDNRGKLSNLTVEERFAFNVSLRMFTRSIVIKRRMEDLQLGFESY
nr:hypothetical protein [Tanacetum cinerariifolium]